MKKLGLALGAGGSRGIAHIGFLTALEENGIKPDYIAGCSMGSVVGACYAGGMSTHKMWEIAKTLKIMNVVDFTANPFGNGGMFRSKKYKALIHKMLPIKTYGHLKIPFACVATDIISGDTVVLDKGNLTENVAASSAIPFVFRPVEHGKMLLIDGGVKCRVPVKTCKKMGADVVVAVDVLGQEIKGKYKFNTLNVLLRAIDIADAELAKFKKETDGADLYFDLDMHGASQYRLKDVELIYDVGYHAGLEAVEKLKELLKD